MRYAVSSYSFRQAIKAGRITQAETVRCAAEMGFDGIEFTELTPCENPTWEQQMEYAAEIRALAEQYGIQVVAYTIGADLYHANTEDSREEVARVMRQVDVAEALGAGLLRHDVCYSTQHDGRVVGFDAMLPVIAENARRITEYAATKGIRTMTENHGFIAQDSDRVERLWHAVGHPNYGLLIDFGNFACADEPSATAVSRLAPYAWHVHAKDFQFYPFGETLPEGARPITTRACNRIVPCAIGDGDIPVAQCVAIMRRGGYEGYLSVEFEGSGDCFEEIRRGLAYLKTC